MVESCTKAWDDRHNVEEHRSCSISQSRRSTRDVGCAPYNLSFLFRSCTRKSPGTIALGGYVHSSKQGSTLIVPFSPFRPRRHTGRIWEYAPSTEQLVSVISAEIYSQVFDRSPIARSHELVIRDSGFSRSREGRAPVDVYDLGFAVDLLPTETLRFPWMSPGE